MTYSYFHYVANCLVQGIKPVPYPRWIWIVDQIERTT
jgi:hypothetical protein